MTQWPREKDVPGFFGKVGENQVRIQLPFPMRLSWQPSQTISSMLCHEKVAESLVRVYRAVLAEYGLEEIRRLRIDLFGGGLNVRPKRGGRDYSMHAWGIAVDHDPDRNQLRWGRDRATFATAPYKAFLDCFEAEGWINLGRARNFDWMHFQAARL